ncbi:hypothetical protein [Nocardiopsis sp. HUAS JQ3]|uniref:hypothetical protein n=1 Tax=Nocardiopsis sp. HUAS JQ3 TaxID=3061629 RepID=UPI0023A94418|nr:hypothetical protein [Nocardiopsis sp. HUAS JQ3]WDZ90773.1 hypothetical protein PV789_28515 [Nocardiopsis sp. HUAS JQ3]
MVASAAAAAASDTTGVYVSAVELCRERPSVADTTLVRRYLLPELAKHHAIDVYEIETAHNPIRASRVDGAEIDPLAANNEVEFTPLWVDVPFPEVPRVAQEEHGRGRHPGHRRRNAPVTFGNPLENPRV